MNDILSLGLNINYDNETDQFIVRNNDAIIIRFGKSNGLYCSYVKTSEALASVHDISNRNENDDHTVKVFMTNDKKVEAAYGLIKRMSVSKNQSMALLRGNVLKDVPFDAFSIKTSRNITFTYLSINFL